MIPEVHALVLWPRASDRADEILADLGTRFRLLAVYSVRWNQHRFGRCLSRFYEDSKMGPRSKKERHIGVGPFLLAVVEDERPEYARRMTSRGPALVHTGMFDAKEQYRRLTGGGHRVHGSVSAAEADRDLFFLIRSRSASFRDAGKWTGGVKLHAGDVVGVAGWSDRAELFTDLEVSLPYVVLDDGPPVVVLIEERWWADVIARIHASRRSTRRFTVPVGGLSLELVMSHVGDGSLEVERQRALLKQRVRGPSGAFVPLDDEERAAALTAIIDGRTSQERRWLRALRSLRV